MKHFVSLILFISSSSWADCVSVNFVSYQYECKDQVCSQPSTTLSPIQIHLDAQGIGEHSQSHQLPGVMSVGSVDIEHQSPYYLIEIKTEYLNSNGSFGEVKAQIVTEDLAHFRPQELNGNPFSVGQTQFFPKVAVSPTSNPYFCP